MLKVRSLGFWEGLWYIYEKDFQSEWSRPIAFCSSLIFSTILAALYSYALDTSLLIQVMSICGLLLASLIFASTLSTTQRFTDELEHGALKIIYWSSLDPFSIYLAKLIAHWQSLLFLGLCCTPIYFLFLRGSFVDFQAHPSLLPLLLLALACCSLSLAALSLVMGYLSMHKATKALVLPLVLLPVSLPIFLFALQFLDINKSLPSCWDIPWYSYAVLVAPTLIYSSLSYLLYLHVSKEAS